MASHHRASGKRPAATADPISPQLLGPRFFDTFGRRDGAAVGAQALLFLPLAGASILVAVLGVWSLMVAATRSGRSDPVSWRVH